MRPPRPRQSRDLAHFGVAQFEIEQREVLFQPLDLAGARNDDDTLLDQPAQTNLRGGLAMRLADLFEHLVALGAAARDRAIGDNRHAVLAAGRDHLVLIEKRMAFDLVADQRLASKSCWLPRAAPR